LGYGASHTGIQMHYFIPELMKKLFLILLLLTAIISSCSVQNYALGTSETEFKKRNKWLTPQLVETSAERTVYKIINGQENGHNTYLYYYFVDSKLVRIDEGEKTPTVVVEHVRAQQ